MSKRFEMRRARLTPVVISHDDWPWPEELVATEVSPRGLYIASDERIVQPGQEVRISFKLGTAERWEYDGYVAHSTHKRRRSDWGYTGMGVELVGVSPVERVWMRALLRGVPPPIPTECHKVAPTPERRRGERKGGRRLMDQPLRRSRWVKGRLTPSGLPPIFGGSGRLV